MSQNSTADVRPRMGYIRWGSGHMLAWKPAFGLGSLLTLAVGALAAWLAPIAPVLAFGIFAVCLWPPLTALSWAGFVDRETMRGADRNPEESVESDWYNRSAQGVFHDVMIGAGLGSAIFTFFPFEVELSWVFLGLTLFVMGDFALRYRINKMRG